MTTRETAEALSNAARGFPLLGEISAQDLLNVVKWELGDEGILDGFQSYAGHQAVARGPETILHVMSGNTPHAGLQSLIRGLLLKAHNYCKLPSGGLDEIARFRDALPDGLKARVDISTTLEPGWIKQAQAVIVFGDDATIGHFRGLTRPEQIFIGHGHKVSLGIVFEDPGYESAPHAARDASLYDQQGCLSPHMFYIAENGPLNARAYASRLAAEMEAFNHRTPRSKIPAQESASITAARNEYEFLSANGGDARVWKSAGGTDWTVIFSAEPKFTPSPLNRVIFVKPLPQDLAAALRDARPWLSTIAVWPATPENAARVAGLGASRICRVGRMQDPPFSWHQDGGQNLAPLVSWIDFDPT